MFKVDKKVIGELEKCYSLAMLHYQGKDDWEVGYCWPLPMGKMAMRLRSLTVAAAQRMCYTMFMKARTLSSVRTVRPMKSRATS